MTTTPHLEPVAARFDLRSPCAAARPWWSAVASATQVAVARERPPPPEGLVVVSEQPLQALLREALSRPRVGPGRGL